MLPMLFSRVKFGNSVATKKRESVRKIKSAYSYSLLVNFMIHSYQKNEVSLFLMPSPILLLSTLFHTHPSLPSHSFLHVKRASY